MTVLTLQHKKINIPNLLQIQQELDTAKVSLDLNYIIDEGGYSTKSDARFVFPSLNSIIGLAGRTFGYHLTRSNSYAILSYVGLGDYFKLQSNDRRNAQNTILLHLRATTNPRHLRVLPDTISVEYSVEDTLTHHFLGTYEWETMPSIELMDLLFVQVDIYKC